MGSRTPTEWFEDMARGRAPGLMHDDCPLLRPLAGCTQPKTHAHDVWGHTVAAYEAAAGYEPLLRLAVHLHDVGKPATRGTHPKTGEPTFYDHHEAGAELVDAWMRDAGFGGFDRAHVVFLVRHHMDLMRMPDAPTDKAMRRWIRSVGSYREPLFALYRADVLGKGHNEMGDIARGDRLHTLAMILVDRDVVQVAPRSLAVSGSDVMRQRNIGPGPEVGRVLRDLTTLVVEHKVANEREPLLLLCTTI